MHATRRDYVLDGLTTAFLTSLRVYFRVLSDYLSQRKKNICYLWTRLVAGRRKSTMVGQSVLLSADCIKMYQFMRRWAKTSKIKLNMATSGTILSGQLHETSEEGQRKRAPSREGKQRWFLSTNQKPCSTITCPRFHYLHSPTLASSYLPPSRLSYCFCLCGANSWSLRWPLVFYAQLVWKRACGFINSIKNIAFQLSRLMFTHCKYLESLSNFQYFMTTFRWLFLKLTFLILIDVLADFIIVLYIVCLVNCNFDCNLDNIQFENTLNLEITNVIASQINN